MALVELVGPPTVGKSTVVAAGVRRGAHDARRSIAPVRHPALAPLGPWIRRTASGGPGRALAGRLLAGPDDARAEAALTAVADPWAPFLDLVVGPAAEGADAASPAGRALRVMGRAWLLEAVRLRALLEAERAADRRDLLDEGVTHPLKVRAVAGDDADRVAAYARVVPLPDVLVVLDAPASVLARRMRERYAADPTRVRWAALGDDASDATIEALVRTTQRTVATLADAAEDRGCPVVRIDVEGRSADEVAATLLARLRSLPHRSGAALR